jgi:hypothetical protein
MNMAQFKFINDIVWHSIETGSRLVRNPAPVSGRGF